MFVREAVVTGVGIVSPIGIGNDRVWESIETQRSGIRHLPQLASAEWLAPFGGEVTDFDPKELVQPRKSLKVMSREIQIGVAAAELAWQDAGLGEATIDPERFGVIGAAGLFYCDLEELRTPFQAWTNAEDFDLHRWSRAAMGELYPLWMLKYLPNMPPCHVGIRYDARGPNNTIVSGDTSSLLALAEAADLIRRDQADLVIVGGTSSRLNISDLTWHAGARVAREDGEDPATICRPFDAHRRGMVFGEGAAQIVLESREHAERRGMRPWARIAGTASRSESTAISQLPTGDAIRRSIQAAMASAGLGARHIGHVNAHGNSTLEDDSIEARAIRQTLGDVPVTALKSFFGNLGASSGALEVAISLLAMQRGVVPPTLNYETPDAECPVKVVTEMRETESPAFIALNHNSTGQAAAVVIAGV